jgi:hypothetical protein
MVELNSQREYRRWRSTQYRRRNAQWLQELKATLACKNCGETHPGCLEFHHLDPTTKETSIAEMIQRGFSRQKILAEIAKCDVLCANCHRKLHWEDRVVLEVPVRPPKRCRVCQTEEDLQAGRCYCRTHWKERQRLHMAACRAGGGAESSLPIE